MLFINIADTINPTLVLSWAPVPPNLPNLARTQPEWFQLCHTWQAALAATDAPPKWLPLKGASPHTRVWIKHLKN